jgi:outer membrane receptor protein involved in Fe transport
MRFDSRSLACTLLCAFAPFARAEENPPQEVVVTGARLTLTGIAASANEGSIGRQQLAARTNYRPGELFEAMPGLIVSQHSGEGKANQFYLRGFNLDHGTDLRTTVDGMPVNQRSHAHGQGWTDLNFLIPELVTRLEYRKGPYYAAEGDFASAGAVSAVYADALPADLLSVGVGEHGYRRALAAGSAGSWLYALEALGNDGPFTHGDNFRKTNAVLRYSRGTPEDGASLTAMVYRASWNATDQIPLRAVNAGRLGRFDAVDPTDGGRSSRYSLSGTWRRGTGASATRANAYVIASDLALYSNFTYFLDDPVNGDQFAQPDRRVTSGLNASHTWRMAGLGLGSENTVGMQLQHDRIRNALANTRAREVLAYTRRDRIAETSLGLYVENATRWTPWLRTVAGVRADRYRYDIDSDQAINSGRADAQLASPKLALVFGPWRDTEFYVNAGRGFHSNDARGVTTVRDPKSGETVEPATPLARARGAELGVRSTAIPGLQSTASLYTLDTDSELVFVGDAGATEAGRPSRRRGVELSNYYKPNRWLSVDADLAYARARFRDAGAAGTRIPGAVEGVASLALALDGVGPYFGALQWRYFGPRPLIEDNSVRSRPTATWNARAGVKLGPRIRVELEVFNLTNRRDAAIDYFYASRLRGETAAREDIHFHPIESRTLRLTLATSL